MYMDKIIKLAKKLDGLISEQETTPQEIYDSLTNVMRNQKEYFSILKPSSIISLVICIFSYRKTGDFKLAANILNHIFYASLVTTDNQNHEEGCDTCYGDGYESCGECDGSGYQTCHECEGHGETECDECEGSGREGYDEENDEDIPCDQCNGKGEMSCPECDGGGELTCNNCAGDGSFTCSDCHGSGTQETEMTDYSSFDICSWDLNLMNVCELNERTEKPVVSMNGLLDNEDVIVLNSDEEKYGLIQKDLNDEELYCLSFQQTRPDLDVKRPSMRIEILVDPSDEEFYFV